jgi:hypothetical protein
MTPEFNALAAAERLVARSATECPYEQCGPGSLCLRCLATALQQVFQVGQVIRLTAGESGPVLQEAILSSYAAGVEAMRMRVRQILGPGAPDLCPRCHTCPCGAPQGMHREIAAMLQET